MADKVGLSQKRLWDDITEFMLRIQLHPNLTVFLLNILWKVLVREKCLLSIFKNVLPIFVLIIAEYRGLNQIILRLRLRFSLVWFYDINQIIMKTLSFQGFFVNVEFLSKDFLVRWYVHYTFSDWYWNFLFEANGMVGIVVNWMIISFFAWLKNVSW